MGFQKLTVGISKFALDFLELESGLGGTVKVVTCQSRCLGETENEELPDSFSQLTSGKSTGQEVRC